jgi:hypothetical protein
LIFAGLTKGDLSVKSGQWKNFTGEPSKKRVIVSGAVCVSLNRPMIAALGIDQELFQAPKECVPIGSWRERLAAIIVGLPAHCQHSLNWATIYASGLPEGAVSAPLRSVE